MLDPIPVCGVNVTINQPRYNHGANDRLNLDCQTRIDTGFDGSNLATGKGYVEQSPST